MNESSEKLITLLREDCTIESLKQEMGLSTPQLIYRLSLLKQAGYTVQQKYYGNGDITVSTTNAYDYLCSHGKIYTRKDEKELRVLVISDLHYFHKDENRKAVDEAYNYCVKNGIHIIFNCGDMIDCLEDNQESVFTQAQKFVELYPYDEKITNFCVLGNHDAMSIHKAGIDLKKVIENKRIDINPIDYTDTRIRIKNDVLALKHLTNTSSCKKAPLTFKGHSHHMKILNNIIYVPSLSSVTTHLTKNFSIKPQALDVTISFDATNGTFKKFVIDQVVMEKQPYITGEFHICLNNQTPYDNKLEIDEYPTEKKIKVKQ